MVGINLKNKTMINLESLPTDIRYRIGMFGLNAVTVKSSEDKKAVVKEFNRFQQRLNYLKQLKLIEKSNQMFFNILNSNHKKNCKIANQSLDYLAEQKPAANFFCTLSLKDLGITKKEVIACCLNVTRHDKQ